MTLLQYQANAVLNAYDEGIVSGLIMAYEKLNPNCTKTEIIEFLKTFAIKDLDYWIDWFQLNK